ncbi:MAG: 30S ribosomal protein S9 [Sphaerochaetaceae bacterium]|nr:30S ribosomal protein S9 [Sphaerochaetaceae bacterium]MDC7237550.1 30S ribosomal protein S9 [Sphaerochaetaceae bacterium]MDC7243168.1 30S ribosomal protein S9 [Sphaerochaetaceae bacterium]MDC7250129.1 30S ribosomal protein S9 [Sphaerochaetaceae bacterium]
MAKKDVKTNVNLGTGLGRRKTSVARVYLREGKGVIKVNGKDVDSYFANPLLVSLLKQPLETTETSDKFDIVITCTGGGISGQAGACRHGIARALCDNDEAYRSALHTAGYMTRDARMVERKKFGQRGARRKFQFSKR